MISIQLFYANNTIQTKEEACEMSTSLLCLCTPTHIFRLTTFLETVREFCTATIIQRIERVRFPNFKVILGMTQLVLIPCGVVFQSLGLVRVTTAAHASRVTATAHIVGELFIAAFFEGIEGFLPDFDLRGWFGIAELTVFPSCKKICRR